MLFLVLHVFACTQRLCFRRLQQALPNLESLLGSSVCLQVLNNLEVSCFPEATGTWLCVHQNVLLPNSLFLPQASILKPNSTSASCTWSKIRVDKFSGGIAPTPSMVCCPSHVNYATLQASFAILSCTIIHHEVC